MPRIALVPPHTPLAALPAVALDLETTGLDVARDRIVQVAAVAMLGGKILDAPRLDRLVNPGIAVPASSTRIHGIADSDVADAPRFGDIADALQEMVRGRVLVGHNIAFDLAILRREAERAGVSWPELPALDVGFLAGALAPSLPDLGLETVAAHLGVVIRNRHSAIGDALAAAAIFAALLPALRERSVRTFAEAQAFAARRDDLVRRQAALGWDVPRGFPRGFDQAEEPAIRIDGYPFQRRLRDVMSAPPIFTDRGTTLRQAGSIMVERRIGALLVGDSGAPPEGIVTERDLLRATAQGLADPDRTAVAAVMTSPVECMRESELMYRALARMDRLHIRHLCIVGDQGIAVGMVSQRDLLRHRTSAATLIDDALAEAKDVEALAAAHARLPVAARHLVAEGLSGPEVGRVVSAELRALSARCVSLALRQLAAEGRGGPPAPWCYLLLGSAGRGESLLAADQDNALIHAGADGDDAWFAALGERVSAHLDTAGVPRCRGGVVAGNAPWRGSSEAWRARLEGWLRRSRPEDLLNVDIFFDMAPVAGEPALGRALHRDAVHAAARHPAFLALLAESVVSFGPRFGLFGQLHSVDGRIDLKRDGLLPLVSLARALSLRAGSTARATPDRLQAAAAAGRIGTDEAEDLVETHALLMGHVLRQQIADLDRGVAPSSRVATSLLTLRERRNLKKRLHDLDGVVQQARSLMAFGG